MHALYSASSRRTAFGGTEAHSFDHFVSPESNASFSENRQNRLDRFRRAETFEAMRTADRYRLSMSSPTSSIGDLSEEGQVSVRER